MRTSVRGPGVEAAFLLLVLFPPPASGAFRFARRYRSRAGSAADRHEGAGMQRIDRHAIVAGKGLHRFPRPVEQRAEFEQSALVDGDEPGPLSVDGLAGAQADDPGRSAVE